MIWTILGLGLLGCGGEPEEVATAQDVQILQVEVECSEASSVDAAAFKSSILQVWDCVESDVYESGERCWTQNTDDLILNGSQLTIDSGCPGTSEDPDARGFWRIQYLAVESPTTG